MLRFRMVALAVIAMLTNATTRATAQEVTRLAVAPASRLWIEGTSNLHDWTCKAQTLETAIDMKTAVASDPASAPSNALAHVRVRVPVKSLKCGHGQMDRNLYRALHADDSSQISYILASFDVAPGETRDAYTLRTVGTLTVNGQQKEIAMDVQVTRNKDGSVNARGVVPVRMTAFGIVPPTAVFGTIKTGDTIKVNFDLVVGSREVAATTVSQP